ncbi:translation initiation factor [Robiginitalea sp. M366]|uniref:translation initiation factor n=1 Tax=Robiginitalea aestuariiviva TaxID=3036903 RepID=UPI00240D11A9|nr:translation initiation factor [Robiginitalea aestuariiviva]MDG1572889.1 translation initiation factor [Robiginitalea aestuariiviva]
MDLSDQLKNLFPDHVPEEEHETADDAKPEGLWLQEAPIRCVFEKRKGKPVTILEGYTGADSDFKTLTRILKQELHVGGGYKDERIIIQGDYRDRIMEVLKGMGFKIKRVGG